MRRVLIESPFAGEVDRNQMYARFCLHDSVTRFREAPYASHLLFTQEFILDDDVPEERKLGIDAGLVWGEAAEKTIVYVDLGMSSGMAYGILNAARATPPRPIEFRNLPEDIWEEFRFECVTREYMVPVERAFDILVYSEEEFMGFAMKLMMQKEGIV